MNPQPAEDAPMEAHTDPPHFPGPLALDDARSSFSLVELSDAAFTRDGPRADVEYRDLKLADATGGRIGARHIRALGPFDKETGWHWHDMSGHFNYVLRGWIAFRFAGIADEVVVRAGACLSQPGGVAHNVVGRSDDLELIEINLPARFGTWDLDAVPSPQRTG
jgi:mannose-6-phosphate isomerase-like protein (cupin superfamily)